MREGYSKTKKVVDAYRQVFLDENGHMSPAARIVMDDLYDHVRLFKDVPMEALPFVEGGRRVVNYIVARVGRRGQELLRKREEEISNEY